MHILDTSSAGIVNVGVEFGAIPNTASFIFGYFWNNQNYLATI